MSGPINCEWICVIVYFSSSSSPLPSLSPSFSVFLFIFYFLEGGYFSRNEQNGPFLPCVLQMKCLQANRAISSPHKPNSSRDLGRSSPTLINASVHKTGIFAQNTPRPWLPFLLYFNSLASMLWQSSRLMGKYYDPVICCLLSNKVIKHQNWLAFCQKLQANFWWKGSRWPL